MRLKLEIVAPSEADDTALDMLINYLGRESRLSHHVQRLCLGHINQIFSVKYLAELVLTLFAHIVHMGGVMEPRHDMLLDEPLD